MIDYNVDSRGIFWVMRHTSNSHNDKYYWRNDDNLPPITPAKMEIGDITLLAEIYLNGEIFYQEYSHTFTEKIGIDNLDK